MMAIKVLVLGLRPRTRTIISHNILGPGNNYYIYLSSVVIDSKVYYSFLEIRGGGSVKEGEIPGINTRMHVPLPLHETLVSHLLFFFSFV